jgi:hypothetical protein
VDRGVGGGFFSDSVASFCDSIHRPAGVLGVKGLFVGGDTLLRTRGVFTNLNTGKNKLCILDPSMTDFLDCYCVFLCLAQKNMRSGEVAWGDFFQRYSELVVIHFSKKD